MGTAPVFADASQALAVARAALGYLAATDATQLTVAEQTGCLQGLEKLNSAAVAARRPEPRDTRGDRCEAPAGGAAVADG